MNHKDRKGIELYMSDYKLCIQDPLTVLLFGGALHNPKYRFFLGFFHVQISQGHPCYILFVLIDFINKLNVMIIFIIK